MEAAGVEPASALVPVGLYKTSKPFHPLYELDINNRLLLHTVVTSVPFYVYMGFFNDNVPPHPKSLT